VKTSKPERYEYLTAKQRKLLRKTAMQHCYGECGCPEMPCRVADYSNGVLCLLQDFALLQAEIKALKRGKSAP
jgi:hypothetical protein